MNQLLSFLFEDKGVGARTEHTSYKTSAGKCTCESDYKLPFKWRVVKDSLQLNYEPDNYSSTISIGNADNATTKEKDFSNKVCQLSTEEAMRREKLVAPRKTVRFKLTGNSLELGGVVYTRE